MALAQAPACPWTCYLPTPFGNCDQGCTFALLSNTSHSYTVPINVQLDPDTSSTSCFANKASETPLNYSQDVTHHHSHHGFFHSSSTTIHWHVNSRTPFCLS